MPPHFASPNLGNTPNLSSHRQSHPSHSKETRFSQVDLKTLATEIAEEQKVRDIGGDEPTLRHRPAAEIIAEMPSRELRPGAKKMMLRPEEEAALPLVCLWDVCLLSVADSASLSAL